MDSGAETDASCTAKGRAYRHALRQPFLDWRARELTTLAGKEGAEELVKELAQEHGAKEWWQAVRAVLGDQYSRLREQAAALTEKSWRLTVRVRRSENPFSLPGASLCSPASSDGFS